MSSKDRWDRKMNDLVFPITISTPFGVGDVHCYLIKDEKNVLIDCGHRSDSSYHQLKKGLQKHRLEIDNIDEIWLTHGHPDHYGQAARLAKESGAVVKGHRKERANFAANSDAQLFKDFFEAHKIDEHIIDEMLGQLEWLQQFQQPIEPQWIKEGATLSSGRLTLAVKHTPGHAPGHVTFYSDGGLIFGGDVLLEHISTNALINFDPDTGVRNKSLLQYRESLRWMSNQEGVVLPGHGKQISNISRIAENHIREQNDRYQKIKELLSERSQNLMQLSQKLFPDALQSGGHFLVFSEIIGYLDWGEELGTIIKEEDEDTMIFKMKN